jgi:filamentous hemagglutinin family protein
MKILVKLCRISLLLWYSSCQAEHLTPTPSNIPGYVTPDGTRVINIAAANAAGYSHNLYSHFNIPVQGMILNNSSQAVHTQLAGMIIANPNLGPHAGIIINEIIYPNPSMLQGMLEVAGPKASVIVANPWGITCNGCGFINAPYVMLTTGTVHFDAYGKLNHYRVEGGSIHIEGRGLDGKNSDYVTLMTRALSVNAEIHAQHLQIFLGNNQLDTQSNDLTPLPAAQHAPPQYALDVGALGGMYANKIFLIGTEKGLGVNYQGSLHAPNSAAVIDAMGNIIVGGTINTDGLKLVSPGTIVHKGVIKAPYLNIKARELTTIAGSTIETWALTLMTNHIAHAGQIFTGQQADIYTHSLITHGPIHGRGEINLSVTQGYDNSQGLVSANKLTLNKDPTYQFTPLNSDGSTSQIIEKTASSGIDVIYTETGDRYITAPGNIRATLNGISVIGSEASQGNIFIEVGNIEAGNHGIYVSHTGTGAVNIKATGTIVSNGNGIFVSSSGPVNIEITGDIIAGNNQVAHIKNKEEL